MTLVAKSGDDRSWTMDVTSLSNDVMLPVISDVIDTSCWCAVVPANYVNPNHQNYTLVLHFKERIKH